MRVEPIDSDLLRRAATEPVGPLAPFAFLLRLSAMTHAPRTAAAAAAVREHATPQPTWQQTLALQCETLGLRTHRAVWSVREAFGTASRGLALASLRPGPGAPGDYFALDEPGRATVRLTREDGSSDRVGLKQLGEWIGTDDLDAPRSWLVVVQRHPASGIAPGAIGDEQVGDDDHEVPPLARVERLIQPDRRDLGAIVAYAAAIGGLSLAVPIAVQQLVNTIAFGGLIQPVVVIALLLLAVLGLSAFLTWVQTLVIELIQQRIFVRVVIDVAERIARVAARAFDRQHGPELVNRIFEVVTVQKAISSLLVEGASAALQIFVGLVILSFYHPLMLAFSLLLVAGIAVAVFWMGRGAVPTAIEESKAKYDVFGWLEELARHPASFRDEDQRRFALDRIDDLATIWIGARRDHFRIVLRQHAGTLALQVVANAALLALGGALVVQGQLTLGQLVASELIIATTVSTVAKLGKQLERFYDLMAAADKLGILLDLPLERGDGIALASSGRPAAVELTGVRFGYGSSPVFAGLDLRIAAGERLAIEGSIGAGKSTLLDLLFALREPSAGSISIDGQDYRQLSRESLRDGVALVRGSEIFAGTLRSNVRVGRDHVDDGEIMRLLDQVGLADDVRALPSGLDTRLSTFGLPLSEVQIARLMIARALITRPRLLLVDRALDDLDRSSRDRISELLFSAESPWTLVVVSEREDVLARSTRRFSLDVPARSPRASHAEASESDGTTEA